MSTVARSDRRSNSLRVPQGLQLRPPGFREFDRMARPETGLSPVRLRSRDEWGVGVERHRMIPALPHELIILVFSASISVYLVLRTLP